MAFPAVPTSFASVEAETEASTDPQIEKSETLKVRKTPVEVGKSKTLKVRKTPGLGSVVNSFFGSSKHSVDIAWSGKYEELEMEHNENQTRLRIHPAQLNQILCDLDEMYRLESIKKSNNGEIPAVNRHDQYLLEQRLKNNHYDYRHTYKILDKIVRKKPFTQYAWPVFMAAFREAYGAKDLRYQSGSLSWQVRIPLTMGLIWAIWLLKQDYQVSNSSFFFYITAFGFYFFMNTKFFWRYIHWISLGLLVIWYLIGEDSARSSRQYIPLIFNLLVWTVLIQVVMWPLFRFAWSIYKKIYRYIFKEESIEAYSPCADDFYDYYDYHPVQYLQGLVDSYRKEDEDYPLVFMVGDSSFLNKHWVLYNRHQQNRETLEEDEKAFWDPKVETPINGYQDFLVDSVDDKPRKKYQLKSMDYWISHWLLQKKAKMGPMGVINAGVEERALKDNDKAERIVQDVLVRNSLRKNDVLMVSIGGNDILLKYDMWIIAAMVWISLAMKVRDVDANTWGIGTFVSIFKDSVQEFVLSLMPPQTENWPSKVLIMFPYFPSYTAENQSGDSSGGHSGGSEWASPILDRVGYFDESKRKQFYEFARMVYSKSTLQLKTSLEKRFKEMAPDREIQVIPFAGYKVLDGSIPDAYEALVEPNILGGAILSFALVEAIQDQYAHENTTFADDSTVYDKIKMKFTEAIKSSKGVRFPASVQKQIKEAYAP